MNSQRDLSTALLYLKSLLRGYKMNVDIVNFTAAAYLYEVWLPKKVVRSYGIVPHSFIMLMLVLT